MSNDLKLTAEEAENFKEESLEDKVRQGFLDRQEELQKLAINLLIGETWGTKLYPEFSKEYMLKLSEFITETRKTKTVFPPKEKTFQALLLTPLNKVKVCLLGQDPYFNENEANGLAFSVNDGIKVPPSLRKIFKAIEKDFDKMDLDQNPDLTRWAEQGVLLINSVLTVNKGEPNSHKDKGWEQFTDRIVELLNEQENPIVFLLFGKYAQEKCKFVDTNKHLVIKVEHPAASAYAGREWDHQGCFKQANEWLKSKGKRGIKWI